MVPLFAFFAAAFVVPDAFWRVGFVCIYFIWVNWGVKFGGEFSNKLLTNRELICIITYADPMGISIEAWLSLVERYVRDVEVAGSNPVAST